MPVEAPAPPTTALDRRLVHKVTLEQTYVTSVQPSTDGWDARVELPKANCLWNDQPGPCHDLLLIAEMARQAVMAGIHLELATPLSAQFVIRALTVEAVDAEALMRRRSDAVLDVEVDASRRRHRADGALAALTGAARCSIGGRDVATFGGTLRLVPPSAYADMREAAVSSNMLVSSGAAVEAPERVGRSDPRNVVTGPVDRDDDAWRGYIAASADHPVFFEHPQDHYPGLLLLELARQVVIAAAARQHRVSAASIAVTGCQASFEGWAELDRPVYCRVTLGELDDRAELTWDGEVFDGERPLSHVHGRAALLGHGELQR